MWNIYKWKRQRIHIPTGQTHVDGFVYVNTDCTREQFNKHVEEATMALKLAFEDAWEAAQQQNALVSQLAEEAGLNPADV